MTIINKQTFIAELGKLLTFMYDEDRQTALNMYGEMFDKAPDEKTLSEFLVSPTRQAVVIARAYNAKERKLQVHAQPKSIVDDEQPDEMPEFIIAIDQIRQEVLEGQGQKEETPVSKDQFTIFADDIRPKSEDITPVVTFVVPSNAPEADTAHMAPPPETFDRTEQAQNANPKTEISPADQVDAFMEDFSIKNDELFSQESEQEQPVEHTDTSVASPNPETERTPKTFLLILFIILAIPLTLIGVAVLLVPTLLFLALAAAAVIGGSVILSAAFSGFAVFADIMVVLGIALVVLALGLLLLWIFVWFIGGAIVGFINSVIRLGGKWCYKEEVLSA